MYLLRKAHVRAYDRVSKTGALQHIREHEDGRVRRYALKLAGSKDSHDLHQIRRDRFGHLPHWNSLDEHTRHAVLDAEDEKARQHKEFEDWKDKVHGKKKPDAVKVDRSGWEQQLMFKSRRVQHVAHILRKSKGNPNHGWHGRFASAPSTNAKPDHSIMPQPMDASMLLPKCSNPDDREEQKKYINLFMQQFGGSMDKSVSYTDSTGKKLNISPRMFKDRKTGEYKIFKNGREQYLLMLAHAIKNPTEIWEDTEIRRGKPTTVRRYVATYRIGGEKVSGVIVFDLMNGRWEGTTAHQRTNVETVRTGTIVYSEIKKAACFANPVARYPYSQSREHGRTSGLTKILSLPENKFNKSHNPLYLVRRRGC